LTIVFETVRITPLVTELPPFYPNKELTTALYKVLVFLDRIIADYRVRMNHILLYYECTMQVANLRRANSPCRVWLAIDHGVKGHGLALRKIELGGHGLTEVTLVLHTREVVRT
jgi:hypothetical protein